MGIMDFFSAMRRLALSDQFSGQVEALIGHHPAGGSTNFSRH